MEQKEMVEKEPQKKIWTKWIKWCLGLMVVLFIVLNFITASHAYNFTHFTNSGYPVESSRHTNLSLQSVVLGVEVNKPINDSIDLDFIEVDTIHNDDNFDLEVWRFDMEPSKGVVVLFHGYLHAKTSLWQEAKAFYRMGYSVLLVDFRGAGNSEGTTCTLGYNEAIDVKRTFQYCQEEFPNQRIFLYGSSMGAVAILRSLVTYNIYPNGIILQSPFTTLFSSIEKRLELQRLPTFPSAYFLTFWSGYFNEFNAFEHNPIEDAAKIKCPTLLIHGMLDQYISYEDSESIFHQLGGPKEFGVFGKSGHESILNKEEPNWVYLVTNFMETHNH